MNRAGGVIRLEPEQNKGRTVRVLALQGELVALVERRWRARKIGRTPAQHVFHRNGYPLGDFRPAWLRACRKAGLGHRWFHSLRRSAARNMSLQGVLEKVIMSIMGHKTRVMFDPIQYNHGVGPARVCEAALRAVNTDNLRLTDWQEIDL